MLYNMLLAASSVIIPVKLGFIHTVNLLRLCILSCRLWCHRKQKFFKKLFKGYYFQASKRRMGSKLLRLHCIIPKECYWSSYSRAYCSKDLWKEEHTY